MAMVSFQFVDSGGTSWMVLAALPADHPAVDESGEGGAVLAGFTFRSSMGEVRVLPRAAVPRRVTLPTSLPPLGTQRRVSSFEPVDWEDLLRRALVWPAA
jgi:hypothetical protein